jgi:hypothetical protein
MRQHAVHGIAFGAKAQTSWAATPREERTPQLNVLSASPCGIPSPLVLLQHRSALPRPPDDVFLRRLIVPKRTESGNGVTVCARFFLKLREGTAEAKIIRACDVVRFALVADR